MELRWLEGFIKLAKEQHFSRAAIAQNLSQPAFSRRIKLLEEAMDVKLINRETLPLSLTPAGVVFLEYAIDVTEKTTKIKQQCLAYKQKAAERIRFATTQALYLCHYNHCLLPLSKSANIEIDYDLQSTAWSGDDFVEALKSHHCDCFLVFWHPDIEFLHPLDSPEFSYLTLANETLLPVSATNESGEPLFTIDSSTSTSLPYITYQKSSVMTPWLDKLILKQGAINLHKVSENAHATGVKAMIKEGYGIGWLPLTMVKKNLQQGSLAAIGSSQWEIKLEVRLYRNKHSKQGKIEEFWDVIEQEMIKVRQANNHSD